MYTLQELRPHIASMSLLGLLYTPCQSSDINPAADSGNENPPSAGEDAHSPSRRATCTRWISLGSKYYCLLVCILIWFQFLRILPAYWVAIDHREDTVVSRVSIMVWYLQCALNATILYRGCTQPDQLQSFVGALKEHSIRYPSCIPSRQQVDQLKRRLLVTARISWTFHALNILVAVVVMLEIDDTSKLYAAALTDPFGTSLPSKITAMVLYSLTSSAWVFPITFSCGLCSYLYVRFKTLTTNLEAAISGSEDCFPPEVETFRRQHIHLCVCVRVLDRMMKNLIMASYVTNIPLMCFVMYNLVYSRGEGLELGALAFWLTVNTINVFFISVWAALVHEEAHSPVDCLYEVNTAGATPEQLAQLQLFVSRVTGTSIGFTALGIVTVTKEMVVTLGGVLTTYFVLLLQYQIN